MPLVPLAGVWRGRFAKPVNHFTRLLFGYASEYLFDGEIVHWFYYQTD